MRIPVSFKPDPALACGVLYHIDGDRGRQDQNVVLPRLDLHAVRDAQAEPLLGRLRDLAAALLEGVFVIEDVALNVDVRSALNVQHKARAQRRDHRLLEAGIRRAARAFDVHRVAHARDLLLNLAQFAAGAIFKDQRAAHAQRLAVYFIDLLAAPVFDPEIVADRDHLLHHLIAVLTAAARPT